MFKKTFTRSIYTILFILLSAKSVFSISDSATVHRETFYLGHTPLDSVYSIEKLSSNIDNLLAKNIKNLNQTNYGIGVYSIKHKKWYYRKNSNKLLTPASTTKLYTTYTLLRQTQNDFYISTEVYHDGTRLPDGTINGNIYIRGKGDALFSTKDLEELADKVRRNGITKINGKVIADGTFYDEKIERIVYSEDKDVVQATPPITALNIDRNAVTIIVTGGPKSGVEANVQLIPSSESHVIINNAKVGYVAPPKSKKNKRKKRSSIDKSNNIKSSEPYFDEVAGDFHLNLLSASAAGVRVTTKLLPDGKQQFYVSGNIKPNSTFSYQHLIHNPPLTIAGAFKNRLKAGGIVVKGDIDVLDRKVSDSIRSRYIFVTDFKRPVFDLINIVNKDSDNYLAEILFKMIGANYGDYNDNAPASRFVIDSIMKSDMIECTDCKINDGSGLSRRNLVTVESMIGILNSATKKHFYENFRNSMSVASIDGTLKKRFKSTTAENNLKAKTGTLRNVSALAGYVNTIDDGELVFAFVFNGPNVGAYKLIENDLGKLLADFFVEEIRIDN